MSHSDKAATPKQGDERVIRGLIFLLFIVWIIGIIVTNGDFLWWAVRIPG